METKRYLTFYVGDQEYGIDILESRAVVQFPTITRLPWMPASIRGVINMRGSILPVVDLAVLFGCEARPSTNWTCVVVVESAGAPGEHSRLGIVVDSVSQVIEVRGEDLESVPAFGTRIPTKFLRGIVTAGATFVHVLDLARVVEHVVHQLQRREALSGVIAAESHGTMR